MGPETTDPPEDRYQPMALVGVTLIALVGFAVFFLSFLVAPLAILMIFFVGFSASDRSKRNGSTNRLADEAQARRSAIERTEEERPDRRAAPLSRAGA